MDYFDPFAAADALEPVRRRPVNWLLVSFDTDWRFGDEHSRRILKRLQGARQPVSFRNIPSTWGHDSFLLELPRYHDTVRAYLRLAASRAGKGRDA
jgi:homoserine O-acetyltransferase